MITTPGRQQQGGTDPRIGADAGHARARLDSTHQPPPVQPDYVTPKYRASSTIATASLVLGIVGLCVPLVGIVAVVCGALGLKQTEDSRVSGRGLAVAGLTLGGVGALLSSVFLSYLFLSLSRERAESGQVKCGSNMRQIGAALLLYSIENRGAYPPDLATLMRAEDFASDTFVCPDSNDTFAPGVDNAAQAGNLYAGGHLSYVYLGRGMTHVEPPGTVVLYENPGAHGGDGMNVLFGDGHVTFLDKAATQKMLAELKVGRNPPKLK